MLITFVHVNHKKRIFTVIAQKSAVLPAKYNVVLWLMYTFRLWKWPQSFPLHLMQKFYFSLTVGFFVVLLSCGNRSEIKREWVIEMEIYGQKVIHSQRNKLLSFISHIYFPRIRWMEQVFLECSATTRTWRTLQALRNRCTLWLLLLDSSAHAHAQVQKLTYYLRLSRCVTATQTQMII